MSYFEKDNHKPVVGSIKVSERYERPDMVRLLRQCAVHPKLCAIKQVFLIFSILSSLFKDQYQNLNLAVFLVQVQI